MDAQAARKRPAQVRAVVATVVVIWLMAALAVGALVNVAMAVGVAAAILASTAGAAGVTLWLATRNPPGSAGRPPPVPPGAQPARRFPVQLLFARCEGESLVVDGLLDGTALPRRGAPFSMCLRRPQSQLVDDLVLEFIAHSVEDSGSIEIEIDPEDGVAARLCTDRGDVRLRLEAWTGPPLDP
ncbi:MAG: hypothetical protein ACRDZ3_13290 [Acidimicrobiia bacterium]